MRDSDYVDRETEILRAVFLAGAKFHETLRTNPPAISVAQQAVADQWHAAMKRAEAHYKEHGGPDA